MVSTVQSSNCVRMVDWMRSSVSRSTAAVASSNTRILVFRSRARARHTSWRCPTLDQEEKARGQRVKTSPDPEPRPELGEEGGGTRCCHDQERPAPRARTRRQRRLRTSQLWSRSRARQGYPKHVASSAWATGQVTDGPVSVPSGGSSHLTLDSTTCLAVVDGMPADEASGGSQTEHAPPPSPLTTRLGWSLRDEGRAQPTRPAPGTPSHRREPRRARPPG